MGTVKVILWIIAVGVYLIACCAVTELIVSCQ